MNTLDVILIVIVVVSSLYGVYRGLIMEIFSVLAFVLGLVLANLGYPHLAPHLHEYLQVPGLDKVVAYFIIFTGISITVTATGFMIKKMAKFVFLEWLDRTLGGVLGFLKGSAVGLIIIAVTSAFVPPENSMVKDSVIAPQVVVLVDQAIKLTPDEVWASFEGKRDEIIASWQDLQQQAQVPPKMTAADLNAPVAEEPDARTGASWKIIPDKKPEAAATGTPTE